MKTLILAALLAVSALVGLAAPEHPAYHSAAASEHVGELAYVTGTISGVKTTANGVTFVNLGQPYPRQDFTAVAFKRGIITLDSDAVGKRFVVFGKIATYKGKPQIVVTSAEQFQVVEK